jgi:hypothetical protein
VLRRSLARIAVLALGALAPIALLAFDAARVGAASTSQGALAAPETTGTRTEQGNGPKSPAKPGPLIRVAMPPVGLSIEYPLIAQYLGTGPCPSPPLIAELLHLGSPPLHIGGNSQDITVPSGALASPLQSWDRSTLYTLPASFWSQLHCLLSATKEPLTAGINMKSGELAWAAQMVAGAESAATNGVAFSMGNEPDLYYLPNYASLGKSLGDRETAGVSLYLQLSALLRQTLGSAPLVAPELAHSDDWQHQLLRVIREVHAQTVGVHLYPLSDCGSPSAVTLTRLLSVESADAAEQLAWVIRDANAAGLPAVISEANSAACGGKAGVSDAPGSAVWAIRFVLSALKTGFREVRFHLSGGPYDPFIVRGARISERPLDTALAALNAWLPLGSTVRTVPSSKGILATALTGAPVQLILDNEHTRAQTIALPFSASVHVDILTSTRAGIAHAVLPVHHGRVKVKIAGESIVAILSS